MEQLLIAILGGAGALLALACAVAWWEHHRRLGAMRLRLSVAECARLEWQRRAQAFDDRPGGDAASPASAAVLPPTPPGQPRRPGQRPTVAPPRPLPAGAEAVSPPSAAAAAAATPLDDASSPGGPPSLPARWEDTQPMVLVPDLEPPPPRAAQAAASPPPVAAPALPPPAAAATPPDFAPTQPMDADAMWPDAAWPEAMAPTQPMPLDLLPSPPAARRSPAPRAGRDAAAPHPPSLQRH